MNSEVYSSFIQIFQPILTLLEEDAFFVNFVLACISFIVNLFHFAIITRKSMRISSINVLMIGVTICDILSMMTTVYRYFELTDLEYPECHYGLLWLFKAKIDSKMFLFTVLLRILMSKRISTSHLGLFKTTSDGVVLGLKSSLRASVRLIIIRGVSSNSIATKPKMGYILMSVVFSTSFVIQAAWQYGAQVVESPCMNSLRNCAEHRDMKNLPKFKLDIRQFSENYETLIIQLYIASDVMVSQFLPSAAFPILTALLLRELRKLHKSRPTVQRNGVVEDHEEKYGLPTKLITLLTITSFLSDAPFGCIVMTKTFLQQGTALIRFLTDLMIYFSIFSTAVSIFRPIMCFLMSSRYRSTAQKLFCTKKKRITDLAENHIRVIPKQT